MAGPPCSRSASFLCGPTPGRYLGWSGSSTTIHGTRLLGRRGLAPPPTHVCRHVCTRTHTHLHTTHAPVHTLAGVHKGTACPGLVLGRKRTWVFLEWIHSHSTSTCCELAPGDRVRTNTNSLLCPTLSGHVPTTRQEGLGGEALGRGSKGPTSLLAALWPSREQVASRAPSPDLMASKSLGWGRGLCSKCTDGVQVRVGGEGLICECLEGSPRDEFRVILAGMSEGRDFLQAGDAHSKQASVGTGAEKLPSRHRPFSHPGQGGSSCRTFHVAAKPRSHLPGCGGGHQRADGRMDVDYKSVHWPRPGPTEKSPPWGNHRRRRGMTSLRAAVKHRHPHLRVHDDQHMGAPGRKTAGPAPQAPSGLKGQGSATALRSQNWS